MRLPMIAGGAFLMVHLDFRSFFLFAMVRRVYKFARYSEKRLPPMLRFSIKTWPQTQELLESKIFELQATHTFDIFSA